MRQQEVFNKMGGIIKELNDQYKYFENNPSDLNELELELFVANTHFLADHAEILSKLNLRSKADKSVEQKAGSTTEKFFEPVIQPSVADTESPGTIDIATDTPEDTYSYIREEPEVIKHELVIDDTADWDEENEPAATEQEPVDVPPVKSKTDKAKPAVEQKDGDDKEEIITINQKISAGLGSTSGIGEQIGTQAVTDLKKAISLNDKLLYIKELFNGYNLAYSEAIEILNRFNSFEEAERFLNKNYVSKNSWESKPGTVEQFYALLKRRYSN